MSTNSEWKELCPPVYPEGDYVAVFCNKCGGKNRQDDGWRYRDDPSRRTEQVSAALMILMAAAGRSLPRLTYECGYCRDDDKRMSVEHEEDEEDVDAEEAPGPSQSSKEIEAEPTIGQKDATEANTEEAVTSEKTVATEEPAGEEVDEKKRKVDATESSEVSEVTTSTFVDKESAKKSKI